jgi:hypothetical protein
VQLHQAAMMTLALQAVPNRQPAAWRAAVPRDALKRWRPSDEGRETSTAATAAPAS